MAVVLDHLTLVCKNLLNFLRLLRGEYKIDDLKSSFVGPSFVDVPHFMVISSNIDKLSAFEHVVSSGPLSDPSSLSREYFTIVSQCFQDRWRSAFRVVMNVSLCIDHLKEISASEFQDSYRIAGKLLGGISSVVYELRHSSQDIIFQDNSAIVLCLHQIKGTLMFLMKGIENSSYYIVKYAAKCLMECLECIGKEVCEWTELPCSEFLELMDCIFSILEGDINAVKIGEIQEQIDELLCHAMATAHVAVDEDDRTAIKAKSQVVLRDLEALKDAVAGEDQREVSLSTSFLNNALCEVERSVNTTVLRLVLDVCSGIQNPLKALIDKCKMDSTESLRKKQPSDLDELIIDFDVFMDRLMQVGTFAVSCCANAKKAMKLRSCLATFESLEAEVVPCVTALFLDTSKANKVCVSLLLDRWINEMKIYHCLLSSIVDPAAYTQVVLNYLRNQFNEMKDTNIESRSKKISNMCKAANSLDPVIATTIEQDSLQDSFEIKSLGRDIRRACNRLLRKLSSKTNSELMESLSNKAGDLVMEVELLWETLARQLLENETHSILGEKVRSGHTKDYYKLCVTDTEIRDGVDLSVMTPFGARGQEMIKGATFYNTPKRSTVHRSARKTPLPRSTVRRTAAPSTVRSRCFRTPGNRTLPDAQSMELTDLLEELTKLDDTFSNQTILQAQKDPLCGKQLLQLFDNWDITEVTEQSSTEITHSVGGNSLESQHVGTFERMRDLELVENKIEDLKTTDDQFITVISIP